MKWENVVWKAVNGKARMSRRKVANVQKIVGAPQFISMASKKGFHVAKIGVQYFVFRDKIDVKC
jgi:hypothetical protein